MKQMMLTERLDTMVAEKKKIPEGQFDRVKKLSGNFAKDSILQNLSLVNQLKESVNNYLTNIETGEHDADFEINTEHGGMSARVSHR